MSLSVCMSVCLFGLEERCRSAKEAGVPFEVRRAKQLHEARHSHLPFSSRCTLHVNCIRATRRARGSSRCHDPHLPPPMPDVSVRLCTSPVGLPAWQRQCGGRFPGTAWESASRRGGWVTRERLPLSREQRKASDSWCCTNTAISNERTHESHV